MFKRTIRKIHLSMRCASSNACDVIIESMEDIGVLTLNRPKALNSLNLSMVKKLLPTLIKWENEKKLVIIKGAGEKAFCAGTDVKAVALGKAKKVGERYFRLEYTMNGIIGSYKIPYIAIIDGITMGGGVGASVHGKYRIATERTMFAMPETQIALFPDAGTTYFLPRLSGKLGLFIALTGHRIIGYDNLKAGIATHFTSSNCIPELEKKLLCCNNENDVKSTLESLCCTKDVEFSLCPHMKQINDYFSADTMEEIMCCLQADKSKWAQTVHKTLLKMSPTSLKVSKELLTRGAQMSLADCLEMEYNVACHTLEKVDFFEGVRALLIDKDKKPKWCPPTIETVSSSLVKEHFAQVPDSLDKEFRCLDADCY